MVITIADCKDVFYCSKGVRLFCLKYDLNYMDLLGKGIEADVLLALNDSMANKVVENKRGE